MRCKDIERLIIDSSERDLNQGELSAIEQHFTQCTECVCFQEDFRNIRISLKKMSTLIPPDELERRTKVLCQDELESRLGSEKQLVSQTRPSPVPWIIWGALVSLIVLTGFFMVSLFRDIGLEQPLSFESVFVLSLMLQNAVMLFFAPVIIRKYQSQRKRFRLV